MNTERWSQIGELFDLTASLPPAERAEWLRNACNGDDHLRAEVESLLSHDSQADRDGFLGGPGASEADLQSVADLPPANGRRSSADAATSIFHSPEVGAGSDGFAPKAAIAPTRPTRSEEETRATIQSRLRSLPLIHILLFGVVLLVRPIVLGRSPSAIVLPYAVVATILTGIALLLSARPFSLGWLRRIELAMTLALMGLLAVYEGRGILGPSLGEDPLIAERITRNMILLVSLVMLIDAIYIPKSWRRTAIISSMLAMLPLITLSGTLLIRPESVQWLGEAQSRAGGIIPLAVFGVDAIFLLTLAAISSFATQTISRLRSEVVEARRFGQYRLGERIGSGGMGEVFLAEHELLKRRCAVKLIRPEVVLRAGTIERFEREVRINATLSHPNTVEVFDYGRTEDGTYYYVMEFLPGMSLADLVDRHGPLHPGRAIHLLRQVALALVEAHEAGLIHRDIKPSNIFAARRGGMDDVAKLLDFGLVRPEAPAASSSSPQTSDEGQILGTPLYMSPEQATGSRTLDARSDIYSLGAVAYFLLTGRPPFDAATAIEAIIAHARDLAAPPSQLRPEVPEDLDAVILRCLAKDPADRFATAEALEVALGRCSATPSWDKAMARRWWHGDQPARHSTG